MSSEAGSHLFL